MLGRHHKFTNTTNLHKDYVKYLFPTPGEAEQGLVENDIDPEAVTIAHPVRAEAGGEATEAVMPQGVGEAVPGAPVNL